MKRVVLLGVSGNGKTTLYNKITNSQNEVKYGGSSITKNIFLKKSAYGKGFELMDTPGFDVLSNQLQHAAGILGALLEGEVSRLVIVLKFEKTEAMERILKKMSQIFSRNKDQITIVVTFWDFSTKFEEDQKEDKVEDKEHVLQCFSKHNINSVLFSSPKVEAQNICMELDDILERSEQRKMYLSEKEIFIHFDIMTLTDEALLQLNGDEAQIMCQFKKMSQAFEIFIQNFDHTKSKLNLVDVMHALILSIKEHADKHIAEYIKGQGDRILKQVDSDGHNVSYLYYICLKKKLFNDVQSVTKKAQEKMQENQEHCYNYIKQCPNCGLVWMKINGCNGVTICGVGIHNKIWEDNLLKFGSQPNQLKVEYQKGEVIVVDPEQPQGWFSWFKTMLVPVEAPKNQIQNINENALDKYKGCNKSFDWGKQKGLTEGKLRELMSFDIIQYFQDNEQIIQDELYYTEEFYKELLREAISDQIQRIVRQV